MTTDDLRRVARLAGLECSEAEIGALRPGLQRLHEGLDGLEALGIAGAEPATTYRAL